MVILLSVVLFAAVFSGAVSLVVRFSGRPPGDITRAKGTPVVGNDPHAGWNTFSDDARPVRRDDPPTNSPATGSQADFDAWEAEHWPKRRTR